MTDRVEQQTLKISISKGTHLQPLVAILARQRAEEPHVNVELVETSTAQQIRGLKEGIYDVGLTLWLDGDNQLIAQPLWYDTLVITVAVDSSLSAYKEIPIDDALRYPIILWRSKACEAMYQRIEKLIEKMRSTPHRVKYVKRFDVMTTLVAAGYGIGFAPYSMIFAAHRPDIVMRPIAETTPSLTTYLLSTDAITSGATERFVNRLLGIYNEGQTTTC